LRLQATYADYTLVARTVPLKAAALDAELWDAARRAFTLANSKRLAVRAVALTLDHLIEKEAQLDLWGGTVVEQDGEPPAALQHAIDHIHSRYGAGALRRGTPLTGGRAPRTHYQTTTTLPKVALPSSTRCASAS
jgi:hypothetical protein